MTRQSSKIICIIFGLIAVYFTISLIPDKTKKELSAFNKEYPFEKEVNISEKFTTDFESSYRIGMSLENPRPYEHMDSMLPMKRDLKVFYKNKPIELYGDNSFMSKSGAEYELKLNFVNANSKPNILRVGIQVDVPGPTYELMIERDFKWVFWIIDGIIVLIAFIAGYFGFRKKPAGNNTYN